MATKAKAKAAKNPKRRSAKDVEQFERFRQFAVDHGADGDPEASDEAARKIIRSPVRSERP